ncbi:MAG: DUF2218 domain-containing protein [Hydrogenophilaceae bacterium]|jgi:hypothetical protein|nr:DUF2218 domain-containing protein [Hydrogenophilaceae bacterium]
MPRLETRIATAHASRYLQQLCKHWSHRLAVSFTPQEGRVDFGEGRGVCTMQAAPDALTLAVESADANVAAGLSGVVFEHLKRFAFRENLADPVWS